MNARVKAAIEHWSYVAPLLQPARNAKEYAQLVEALDAAIDAGGADEKHPLARLVDYLGDLVAEYEAKDKMPAAATGADALRYLMQRDGLRQADLPELGSQGVVSELLSGRREFNARQAKALAERFGVSAALFL
jgi:HTH-type transcriptional regulator / antitoxin HigA